jgi:DNA mismatch repair protein MutS
MPYVPNDIFLIRKTQQMIMITGPNMSGKSAILRQTAVNCTVGSNEVCSLLTA